MRVKRGYWQDFDNIRLWVYDYIGKHGLEKLNYKDLKANGCNDFINGIKRQGLSLEEICQTLGLPVLFTPKDYLKDINNVCYEVKRLIDKYGCFPTAEILISEGKSAIDVAMARYHGGRQKIFDLIGYEKGKQSALEASVKTILDKYVDDDHYIDNGRKILRKYGLDTQNPETKQHFEIDRYYYDAKVAIEINGSQHYRGSGSSNVWTVERTKRIVEIDMLKATMLHNQGIKLIEISCDKCSEEEILRQLKMCAKLKLR